MQIKRTQLADADLIDLYIYGAQQFGVAMATFLGKRFLILSMVTINALFSLGKSFSSKSNNSNCPSVVLAWI